MVEFDRTAFIAKFEEEAQDLLQRLNEGVITLEGDPENRELIDQMMRDAHTIKGSSRMVGLIEISDVAHWLEDIMVKVRDGELPYTSKMSDHFFEALDAIVYLADNKGVNEGDALDLEGLRSRLAAIAEGGTHDAAAATATATAGDGLTTPPEAEEPAPSPKKKSARGKAAKVTAEAADLSPAAAAEAPDAPGTKVRQVDAKAAPDELTSKVQTTIRIRTSQVDSLLNLISEVVISQIKAEQRASELRVLLAQQGETSEMWQRIRALLLSLGFRPTWLEPSRTNRPRRS